MCTASAVYFVTCYQPVSLGGFSLSEKPIYIYIVTLQQECMPVALQEAFRPSFEEYFMQEQQSKIEC